MELYYAVAVLNRDKEKRFRDLCRELKISAVFSVLGRGTATQSVLRLYDLQPTEKSMVRAIVTAPTMRRLLRVAKRNMFMDIPGNGIMFSIPIKSVSGKKTLERLTEGQSVEGTAPAMEFQNELIIVILNEGHADAVMDAAREAGATGGTIVHAKGTDRQGIARFLGMTVAEEKDMLYILASSGKKSQIMKAIGSNCGVGTEAGAVSFSLPVSEVVGIRRLDDDE